ncbi:hypothetical protein Trydic_g15014 [Trypoxylus dichotomus]
MISRASTKQTRSASRASLTALQSSARRRRSCQQNGFFFRGGGGRSDVYRAIIALNGIAHCVEPNGVESVARFQRFASAKIGKPLCHGVFIIATVRTGSDANVLSLSGANTSYTAVLARDTISPPPILPPGVVEKGDYSKPL